MHCTVFLSINSPKKSYFPKMSFIKKKNNNKKQGEKQKGQEHGKDMCGHANSKDILKSRGTTRHDRLYKKRNQKHETHKISFLCSQPLPGEGAHWKSHCFQELLRWGTDAASWHWDKKEQNAWRMQESLSCFMALTEKRSWEVTRRIAL